MKTIETKVYTFDELSDSAKDKARDWYLKINYDDMRFAFELTVEDAKNIGLVIESLDDRRANKGRFDIGALDTAERILKEHGEQCETYKTAMQFLEALQDDENEDAPEEFLQALLEDYRIMLHKDEEYRTSNEYVDETILANEYTFTEAGKRFG